MSMLRAKASNDEIRNKMDPGDLWTVFLVEDDADDQMLATRVLKESPQIGEVICVSESISLFDYIARHQFHVKNHNPQRILILLDIYMPGLNGLMLLEQLRASPDTSNLPVIIVTGDQNPEKVFQSYRRNASCFINKPITSKHLMDVHTVLEYGSNWYNGR